MDVQALEQLSLLTAYTQDYSTIVTIGFGLIIGLLCVLIVKRGD